MADSANTPTGSNLKTSEGKNMSIWKIYKYADFVDVLMMVLGTLGSIADGSLGYAGVFIITIGLLNTLGSDPLALKYDDFMQRMNKQIVQFLYLAAGVWIAAFLEAFCWTRTGERQASALRRKYLRAVLRQDVGFFDIRGTHIAEVVNSVYNDTLVIQDTLSEKEDLEFGDFLLQQEAEWSPKLTAMALRKVALGLKRVVAVTDLKRVAADLKKVVNEMLMVWLEH